MDELILQVNHLSKTFGNNEVLKDIDFSVSKGDVISIIGASGSGKSTLLRCINLLERPDSGSVRIDGVEMTQLKPRDLYNARRKIGMIFQQFNLMPSRTVAQNVGLSLTKYCTQLSSTAATAPCSASSGP